MEPTSPEGDLILTHLKIIKFSRTQALHTFHICPKVPKLSLLSPWVLLCRVLSGAMVQICRSLHRGAGLGLKTLNATSSSSRGARGPAGKSVGKEGGFLEKRVVWAVG